MVPGISWKGVMGLVMVLAMGVTGVKASEESAPGKGIEVLDIKVNRLTQGDEHPLMDGRGIVIETLEGGFSGVGGMKWDSGKKRLYLSDTDGHRVVMVDDFSSGAFERFIGGPEGEEDKYGKMLLHVVRPSGLELDRHGKLIVCDLERAGIWRRESRYRWKMLASEFRDTPLGGPVDICLAPDGDYYFTDNPSEDGQNGVSGVFRRSKNGRISLLNDGLTRPAGIAINDGGTFLLVANADPEHAAVFRFEFENNNRLGDPVPWPATAGVESHWDHPPTAITNIGNDCFAVSSGTKVSFFGKEGIALGTVELPEVIHALEYAPEAETLYFGGEKHLFRGYPSRNRQ